jgi:hypothetical protein
VKTPELKHAHVVAAMYATFISNETESVKFWETVARGGKEYEDNHPTTVLDDWLKKAFDRKEGDRLKLKPGEYYMGSLYAWNAHRAGKEIKSARTDKPGAGRNGPPLL